MKIPAFVPADLRQLVRFVPLRGWDAVQWQPLLGSLRSLSLRFVTGQGVGRLRRVVADSVPDVLLVDSLRGVRRYEDIEPGIARRAAGDDLLRLYFGQWLVEEGLFIDLRSTRLGSDDEDTLHFSPNGLWIRLRPEFRQGMLALYRSFYSDDADAFDAALRQMGLLRPGLSPAAASELTELLNAHFGIDQRAQRFSIDSFKQSFDALFEFFIANDYRLHSDFVFVGFYLITLYLTLEAGGEAHDVRSICSEMLR